MLTGALPLADDPDGLRSSDRNVLAVALLASFAVGCGRLGFETTSDAAPSLDAGIDAPAPRDAGTDASCSPAGDPCTELRMLATAPTIDGVLEPCLTTVPINPVGWTGSIAFPANVHARGAYGWRPNGVYFYVEVDDPNLFPGVPPVATYCGDGVEIYVDDDGTFSTPGRYDVPGTIQLVAAAPTSTSGTSTYGQRFIEAMFTANWSSFAMIGRPGGYALEALVQASDLGRASWTLTPGQHIGLDVGVNVSTADGSPGTGTSSCGRRIGQYFLRVARTGACVDPYCGTAAFCTPVLR